MFIVCQYSDIGQTKWIIFTIQQATQVYLNMSSLYFVKIFLYTYHGSTLINTVCIVGFIAVGEVPLGTKMMEAQPPGGTL